MFYTFIYTRYITTVDSLNPGCWRTKDIAFELDLYGGLSTVFN